MAHAYCKKCPQKSSTTSKQALPPNAACRRYQCEGTNLQPTVGSTPVHCPLSILPCPRVVSFPVAVAADYASAGCGRV
eukprot:scaffold15442_cov140-Isochrysis_galbana.AAC.2